MPALDEPVRFTLRDAAKVEHEYVVALHGAIEGQALAWEMVAAGAEPLARILASSGTLTALAAASGGDDPGDDATVSGDALAAIGRDVRSAIGSLNAPRTTRRILQYASRDGHPLADDRQFDAAYRGNYAEMFLAVRRVTEINRFLPTDLISELVPKPTSTSSTPSAPSP